MCGRFTLRTPARDLVEHFELAQLPALLPRYNVAPTQDVMVVRLSPAKEREARLLRWGLVPPWAEDAQVGHRLINARAETVAGKPAFRHAFRQRRCLIAADGFFEWQRQGRKKQPFHFRLRDEGPIGLAGLWECWRSPGGEELQSCAIIVTEANEVVQPVHDRMPVILHPDDYSIWLDPEFEGFAHLQGLLRPYDSAAMIATPVSTLVNSPQNDRPECLQPAEQEKWLF